MTDHERAQTISHLTALSDYPRLIRLLRDTLERERAAYEGADNSEHRRGRVTMIRDLCREFPHSGV